MLGLAVLVHSQSGLWSGVRPAEEGLFPADLSPAARTPRSKPRNSRNFHFKPKKLRCFSTTMVKLGLQTRKFASLAFECKLSPSSEKIPKKPSALPGCCLPLPPHHTKANPKLTLPSFGTDTHSDTQTDTQTHRYRQRHTHRHEH